MKSFPPMGPEYVGQAHKTAKYPSRLSSNKSIIFILKTMLDIDRLMVRHPVLILTLLSRHDIS